MSVEAAVEFAGSRAARAPVPGVPPAGADRTKIREAAREFEAVFLSQFLSAMWEGIEVDPTLGGGHGEEVFRSMLLNEYGRNMARAGGLGFCARMRSASPKSTSSVSRRSKL